MMRSVSDRLRDAYRACGLEQGAALTAGERRRLNAAMLRDLGVDEAEIAYHAAPPVEADDERPAAIQARLAGF